MHYVYQCNKYAGIVDIYIFHEIAKKLFFSHLLTKVYTGNWATLLVVLVALYDVWNDSES